MRRLAAAAVGARQGADGSRLLHHLLDRLSAIFARAARREIDDRRLFLWTPPAAGGGVALYFSADREPSAVFALVALLALASIAFAVRQRPAPYALSVGCAAILFGFASASLRTAEVSAPTIDRIQIVNLTGFIEEIDPRARGARFLLRVAEAEGLDKSATPVRVRLTTNRATPFHAGDFVALKARLLPPAQAAIPGGYNFARDAFFARIGAVGSVLGVLREAQPPTAPLLSLRIFAQIDHARNALARRIADVLAEPAASVAVAMVTGKRDYLDDSTKDVIRQAGIFHIITISGVQMTLVAGVVFWSVRRLLALSRSLALNQPIKIWSAVVAMAATLLYDLGTGSRIGAQRALIMTLFMLGAVVCGRRALSMRNLAFAAASVILIEPEAVLGASFQLSFAAVTALVAVQEARRAQRTKRAAGASLLDRRDMLLRIIDKIRDGPIRLLFATACATGATASFMAYDFHELSPYVLIGNPLTFIVIELFAVPCALVGALLYPLGLDALVWRYLGAGITFILWAASWIAAAPGAEIHLVAFAPWALVFLALAFLSLAIWRTAPMRLAAIPFAALGLWGATLGLRYGLDVAPSGDSVAVRDSGGRLIVMGRRPSPFAVEQWLSADADGRAAKEAILGRRGDPQDGVRCDALGCVADEPDAIVALVLDPRAFQEDCGRADVIVSPLIAPPECGARLVLDRRRLAATGAVSVKFTDDLIETSTARAPSEDRPWSRAPRPRYERRDADDGRTTLDGDALDPWRESQPF